MQMRLSVKLFRQNKCSLLDFLCIHEKIMFSRKTLLHNASLQSFLYIFSPFFITILIACPGEITFRQNREQRSCHVASMSDLL